MERIICFGQNLFKCFKGKGLRRHLVDTKPNSANPTFVQWKPNFFLDVFEQ